MIHDEAAPGVRHDDGGKDAPSDSPPRAGASVFPDLGALFLSRVSSGDPEACVLGAAINRWRAACAKSARWIKDRRLRGAPPTREESLLEAGRARAALDEVVVAVRAYRAKWEPPAAEAPPPEGT